ncbi:MAG: RNA polymerase sigma factor [Arcicella sp.]|jgi:RNA polymerase sigma-70 factor (ECF subfamily)|nr:RNA polymerase sigma factor [Arcicella sp.]
MTEQELLNQLQNGNESAFKTLVETHQKRVFSTVLAIVQSFEEAEDISQDVFIEVYQSIHKFRGESKISTWLYRIATTKSLEIIRKKKTQKRFAFFTNLFNDDNEVIHNPVEFEHPGILLENKERSKQLFKAINQLPDNQKVAYTLCNIEGLSYQEITEVMEVSLSSVESLLFRAKANLKKSLHNIYYSQKI